MNENEHDRWSDDLPPTCSARWSPASRRSSSATSRTARTAGRRWSGCGPASVAAGDGRAGRAAPASCASGSSPRSAPRRSRRTRRRERRAARRRRRLGACGRSPAGSPLALALAAVAGYAIGHGGPTAAATTTVAARQGAGVTAKMVSEGDAGTLELANVHELPDDRVLEAWSNATARSTPVGRSSSPTATDAPRPRSPTPAGSKW